MNITLRDGKLVSLEQIKSKTSVYYGTDIPEGPFLLLALIDKIEELQSKQVVINIDNDCKDRDSNPIVYFEKDDSRTTVTVGFERADGDLQVLATLNNNDSLISSEFFEFMVKQLVQTFELAGVKVTNYERQDAPDYTDLSDESDHRFHFQENKHPK